MFIHNLPWKPFSIPAITPVHITDCSLLNEALGVINLKSAVSLVAVVSLVSVSQQANSAKPKTARNNFFIYCYKRKDK
jgi:hypothetical protein